MKRLIAVAGCFSLLLMLVGCAAPYGAGGIYSDFSAPMSAPTDETGLVPGSKTGKAEMINILGWVATGDASITAAAKNGGIKKIKTADFHFHNILGIIQKTTTTVTGE